MIKEYVGPNFKAECTIEDNCLTYVKITSYDGELTDEVSNKLIRIVMDDEDSILGFEPTSYKD